MILQALLDAVFSRAELLLFPGYPPARIVGVSYRFRSYLVAQGRAACTDFSGSQRHRMLRDRALRKTYARQVFY